MQISCSHQLNITYMRLPRNNVYDFATANFLIKTSRVSFIDSSMEGNANHAVIKPNKPPVNTRMNGVLS